jgi:hypothetical protein
MKRRITLMTVATKSKLTLSHVLNLNSWLPVRSVLLENMMLLVICKKSKAVCSVIQDLSRETKVVATIWLIHLVKIVLINHMDVSSAKPIKDSLMVMSMRSKSV